MNIYILRHGKASPSNDGDFYRELDVRGRHEVQNIATKLIHTHLQKIMSSPLVRARQTAEIVRNVLDLDIDIEEWPQISPAGDPQIVVSCLEQIEASNILLVSHQPLVSRLVEFVSDKQIYLGTAAVIGIEMEILQAHCGRIIMQEKGSKGGKK